MGILTREQILQADDLQRELVEVPEWDGQVYVRCLTGAERDRYEASIIDVNNKDGPPNLENLRAKLVSLTTVDESGERLFSEGDIRALGEKNSAPLQRIFTVAQRLSAISNTDVEELSKN